MTTSVLAEAFGVSEADIERFGRAVATRSENPVRLETAARARPWRPIA